MGKYGDLIKEAKAESQEAIKPESQKTRNMENQKTRIDESQETSDLVNLGVKVPLAWRRHWAAQSKLTGVSMTEVIIEALTKRFGKPE